MILASCSNCKAWRHFHTSYGYCTHRLGAGRYWDIVSAGYACGDHQMIDQNVKHERHEQLVKEYGAGHGDTGRTPGGA